MDNAPDLVGIRLGLLENRTEAGGALSGVITDSGAEWLLGECQPGDNDLHVDVDVYRWTGGAWLREAAFQHVPDHNAIIGLTGWYRVVPAGGATIPAFRISGDEPDWTMVVTDAGGVWHLTS